ncbi:DUF2242 domain-containing protein [Melaminivora sp.]|uniref:DUF2242 domain-containing protein n=1 Tax=Melaminivora sp. TaxID=1933032 RepID=UPI0028A94903|nr:DUF2242 domain-containing protein [Melaminivora sp.]
MNPRPFRLRTAIAATLALALAACSAIPDSVPALERGVVPFKPNDFDSSGTFMRHVGAPQERTCEAARRALLSQGYLVHTASADLVAGRKYYQPQTDTHYAIELRIVCAPEGAQGQNTSVFASALQDRYVIKKVNNSASLGVGGIGSVSLPVSATDDTLVKVGSETLRDSQFYDRFFQLFERYVPLLPAGAQDESLPLLIPPAQSQPVAAPTSLPAAALAPLPAPGASPDATLPTDAQHDVPGQESPLHNDARQDGEDPS